MTEEDRMKYVDHLVDRLITLQDEKASKTLTSDEIREIVETAFRAFYVDFWLRLQEMRSHPLTCQIWEGKPCDCPPASEAA